jgi:HSP20 family protein
MGNLLSWKKPNGADTLAAGPLDRELARFRGDFDSLLERICQNWQEPEGLWLDNKFGPGLDMEETESSYVIHVTAPGFEVGDFDVSICGHQLVIKAERKESHDGQNGSSRRYGRVQHAVTLPDGALTDLVEAQYKAGILSVSLPKGRQSQAKRIPVKSA